MGQDLGPAVSAGGHNALVRFLRWSFEDRRMLAVILLTNVGGIAFGFFWYREQLASTPAYWWPLIPDSPAAVLLFSAALLLRATQRQRPWLEWLGWILMVKVGIWSVVILQYHHDYFFTPELAALNTVLAILHAGMAAQALILLHKMERLPPMQSVAILAYLLLSDAADYGLGLHPRMPAEGIEVVGAVTVALSLVSFAVLWWLVDVWPRTSSDLSST